MGSSRGGKPRKDSEKKNAPAAPAGQWRATTLDPMPFVTYDWMMQPAPYGLGIRGNELTLYGLIYGVSHHGVGEFSHPVPETARMMCCSERSVRRLLRRLEADGLIYQSSCYRPDGQHGGQEVRRYAVCQRRVDEVLAARSDAVLADMRLGRMITKDVENSSRSPAQPDRLSGCEPDAAGHTDNLSGCENGALTCEDASFQQGYSIPNTQYTLLEREVKKGEITASDAVILSQLMEIAPIPVDEAHMPQLVSAYREAIEDGFTPEDMVGGLRSYVSWAGRTSGRTGRKIDMYLYVYLRRGKGGGHNRFLESARKRVELKGGDNGSAKPEASTKHGTTHCLSAPSDAEMTVEQCALELNRLAPAKAGRRKGELAEAVGYVLSLVPRGQPRQLVSAYRRYLAGGGDKRYALTWLLADGISDTGGAVWCLAHELCVSDRCG